MGLFILLLSVGTVLLISHIICHEHGKWFGYILLALFPIVSIGVALCISDVHIRTLAFAKFCAGGHCLCCCCPIFIFGIIFLFLDNQDWNQVGIVSVLTALGILVAFWVRAAYFMWCTPAWKGQAMAYEQIAPYLKNGDIVLLLDGGTASWLILYFTACQYSHSGLIVKDPPDYFLQRYYIPWHRKDPFNCYVLETEPAFDEASYDPEMMAAAGDFRGGKGGIFNPGKGGVHITPLVEYLQMGCNLFTVRCIDRPVGENDQRYIQWAMTDDVSHAPYDWKHFACGFCRWQLHEDSSEFFCSELVAAGLQQLGVVDPHCVAENFAPHSFSLDDHKLPLCPGIHLRDPVMIFPLD